MRYYNVYLYSECQDNCDNYPNYWVWKIENASQEDTIPNGATRMSLNELMQYKKDKRSDINSWITSQVSFSTLADKKVKKAIQSVNNVVSKYCAENIVAGITQAGKTKLIADTLKDVFYYAQTGSLYECLNALDAIEITPETSPFLTETIRSDLKNKINNLITNL